MGIKKNLHNHLADQPTLDYDLHQGATRNLDPSYGPIEGIIVHNEQEPKKPGVWRKVGQFFKKVYSGIRKVADYVVSHRDNSNFSMPYASDQPVIKTPVSPDLNPIDFSQYIHTPQRPYPLVDQGTEDYFRQQFQNQIDLNELKANARKEVRAKALNIWNSRKQDDITKINLRPYQAFFDNLDRTNPTISYLHDRMRVRACGPCSSGFRPHLCLLKTYKYS